MGLSTDMLSTDITSLKCNDSFIYGKVLERFPIPINGDSRETKKSFSKKLTFDSVDLTDSQWHLYHSE
jgi:hypothetical protein